jgi:Ca2+-binding EF-hand superfamily protein
MSDFSQTFEKVNKKLKHAPKLVSTIVQTTSSWEEIVFKEIDVNESGQINLIEFMEFCKYAGLFLKKETFIEIFASVDVDKDQHLDLNEFKEALSLLRKLILK